MSFFFMVLSACSQQDTPTHETQEAITSYIRSHHIPVNLGADAGLANWQSFDSLIGSARVIGLGEATHGTEESDAINCAIIKHLVETKGCTMICVENNADITIRVNRYVLGGSDNDQLFLGNSRSIQLLIDWVRSYNAQNKAKVRFYGLNFYGVDQITEAILERIHTANSAYYDSARMKLDGFRTYSAPNGIRVGFTISPDSMRSLHRSAVNVLNYIKMNNHRFSAGLDSYSLSELMQFLNLLVQSVSVPDPNQEKPSSVQIQIFKTLGMATKRYDYSIFDAYRDSCMFENARWAIEQTPKLSPVVVWAHNLHIAKRTENSNSQTLPVYKRMGAYLQDNYKTAYKTIGYTFFEGKYIAMNLQGKVSKIESETPPIGSIERMLQQPTIPAFFISTHELASAAENFFQKQFPIRSVGVSQQATEFREKAALSEFDAL
ncbi:MAG: erythromycin esterase family protein, partial [Ignavibacteria bacterium]|nr:erythromycin esterase family protein [Ignavibacteria bacterium]